MPKRDLISFSVRRYRPFKCRALARSTGDWCRKRPVKGRTRCRWHGGLSTGPRTVEGKARAVAAMVAGRRRWVEKMRALKAEGKIKRFPGGRRAGPSWFTARMAWRKMKRFSSD